MSTQRPTPETDAMFTALNHRLSNAIDPADFARKLERERNEAREELENILNVIPADAPCLHAETGETVADYILGMQKEVGRVHALYFNDKKQLEAMREAIKEAHDALVEAADYFRLDGRSVALNLPLTPAALAKLSEFIDKPNKIG